VREVAPSHGVVRFSAFEVDFRKGEVRKHGFKIRLQAQPFHILQILLERPGELVTREELQRQVWPADTFVDFEKGLNNAIKKLRDALGDSAEQPRFIETQARRGYRFIGSVTSTNEAGRTEAGASSGEVGAPARSRALYRRLVISGVLFVALVATLFGFDIGGVRERWLTRASSPAIHSLAVIPLANLSNDPNQEYFSDGMTDALITDLAQLGSLRVISRTSSMRYKQTKKSLPEIARELNVDGIVEGTVQRAGDRVRISAQLIHAASDKHLWAKSYEGDTRDVFAMERDVTDNIAQQIQTRLEAPKQGSPKQALTVNPQVLDAYLEGNYHLHKYSRGSGDEEKRKASQLFQRVIEAEPNFAPAYVGMALAHFDLSQSSIEDLAITKKAVERAVQLDSDASEAWSVLAQMKEYTVLDMPGAEADYRRAVTVNPNSASAHGSFGEFLGEMGRLDEGLKECEIAQQLDPNEDHLSRILYLRREYDRGIAIVQIILKTHPDDGYQHFQLYEFYTKKGMHKEAVEHLEQALELFGFSGSAGEIDRAFALSGFTGAMRQLARELENWRDTGQAFLPANLALTYAALGEKDRAFYWLEQAYQHRDIVGTDTPLPYLVRDPMADPLRSDARFADLVRRLGLSP